MTAIILVGGAGTRTRHLHPDLPKPLIAACGKPFLHWVTRWVAAQGETHVIYSAGHLAEKIAAWIEKEQAADPTIVRELVAEKEPLGTGGAAVLCAAKARLGGAEIYLIANGDSLVVTSLGPAYTRMKADTALDGMILGVELEDATRYGCLDRDGDGILRGFREKRLATLSPRRSLRRSQGRSRSGSDGGLVNGGVYLLKRRLLEEYEAGRPLSIEYDCFPTWLKRGRRIGVLTVKAPFLDIGTPESLIQRDAFIASHMKNFQ